MIQKIFLYFFLIFDLISFSLEEKKLKVLENFEKLIISIDGMDRKCNHCMPSKIKSNNGTISISIPRIFNHTKISDSSGNATFIILRTELDYEHYWLTWPTEKYIALLENYENKIYSVMGFEIDVSQNYYLLDQGVILPENNTIEYNTSKLLIFNRFGKLIKEYFFTDEDYTTSLLTDIVVDQSQRYAYITDSGILLNNQSFPRIIVIDLEKDKIYKILNNHTLLKPDKNINITYTEDDIINYFTEITGLNSIQISCDGKKLYFSSLKSNNLYKVNIKDLSKAIDKYEDNKNSKYLNDIPITVANKGMISQSFIMSSKNNIYLTNNEKGSIRTLYSLDDDLSDYNFGDFSEIESEKLVINWPGSIDIENGVLYLLDNHYINRTNGDTNNSISKMNNFYFTGDDIKNDTDNDTEKGGYLVIYTAKLPKDELSYKHGCSVYIFEANEYTICLIVIFILILLVVIFVMIINKERKNKKKDKNKNNEDECDENVNELNRRLNENQDEKENEAEMDNNEDD